MSKYWSPIVSTLKPYVAGEQPRIANLVKLNTNENPYGPSPKALEAIKNASDNGLRLYPDPVALELREAIAALHGVDAGEVFVGNGSDEVLAHTFQGLLNHDAPLLYPDITYSFYPVYSLLYGIESQQVPLDENFGIRLSDYDRPCGAIILPNPNAPTGIGLPLADIEALVAAHPDQPVVIDEAYVDFGGESAIPLTRKYPNLLVVQTFSKSRSLAGMRVGFAIGQRPLIDALERVKDSFNSYPLDKLAQVAAKAAIEMWNGSRPAAAASSKAASVWSRALSNAASAFCPRSPTSSSQAIRTLPGPISLRNSANAPSSYATSPSRASIPSCAFPSARKRNATGLSKRSTIFSRTGDFR